MRIKKFEYLLQKKEIKDFYEFELEIVDKDGFYNLLDSQLRTFQDTRNLIEKIIWVNKIMDNINRLLQRIEMDVEKKNFDIILSYWLIKNQENYVNLENYIHKPLYCQIKIIKAFYKDVLEEIMDDRFRMFRQILRTFYQKKNIEKAMRFKQSPLQTDFFKNKVGR